MEDSFDATNRVKGIFYDYEGAMPWRTKKIKAAMLTTAAFIADVLPTTFLVPSLG